MLSNKKEFDVNKINGHVFGQEKDLMLKLKNGEIDEDEFERMVDKI